MPQAAAMAAGGDPGYGFVMSTTARPTFFATLRRDRLLFALVGAFVLLLNMMQPLAAAQGGEDGHWVICTPGGMLEPPAAMPQSCPVCLLGNGCPGGVPAYRAALAADPAFPGAYALAAVRPDPRRQPAFAPRPGDPPPAIRAPPLSA